MIGYKTGIVHSFLISYCYNYWVDSYISQDRLSGTVVANDLRNLDGFKKQWFIYHPCGISIIGWLYPLFSLSTSLFHLENESDKAAPFKDIAMLITERKKQGTREYSDFQNFCSEEAHITSTFILLDKAPIVILFMGPLYKHWVVKDKGDWPLNESYYPPYYLVSLLCQNRVSRHWDIRHKDLCLCVYSYRSWMKDWEFQPY